ncbi:lipase maturation factor family protein [Microbacterium sp. MPKO10]|uniref:lipase maturation factor family protein n=1 Tax=Microbacterium sp. MPKO10 TaxID=2989818 RepID=UPI002235B2AF|nr:lipase maturation factor family protein [Microbacterium sp. MPKO10]MCW4456889.1 lipase maturation factor family protein [Microbacterium sp. MPKO10]
MTAPGVISAAAFAAGAEPSVSFTDILAFFDAGDYTIAREVLQRGIAAVFVIAFVSAIAQFPALLGERGLLPAPRLIARSSGRRLPSIFRLRPFRYSDRMLRLTAALGVAVAASLVLGLPQLGPPWLPLIAFALLWVLYLSIVNIGQVFYGFGWESLLLECGVIAAFLGSNQTAPPLLVMVFFWWLVVRIELGAGLIKMRGDSSWRDLTAMTFHHETQPMPGPLSRQAHLLPRSVHRAETLGNHLVQLGMPLLLFAPQPIAGIATLLIIATQLWLVLTGNFAWLNVLTIVVAFSGVSDSVLGWIVGHGWPGWSWFGLPLEDGGTDAASRSAEAGAAVTASASPLWWLALTTLAFLVGAWLSVPAVRNLFSRNQLMNASFNRLGIGNAYGAFGSVTQLRREVEIEGTLAENPGESDWHAYGFKGKPGDVRRRPRQFAPYHLRLDWLMWFLALGGGSALWFERLIRALLDADAATLRLLRHDPFGGAPPRAIRVRVFAYRFATRAEKRETGAVWVRDELATLVPPVSRGQW